MSAVVEGLFTKGCGGWQMILDYVEKFYNVRECGNRVQIVHTENVVYGVHYVSARDLVDGEYVHRSGQTEGFGDRCAAEARVAELYEREAKGGVK